MNFRLGLKRVYVVGVVIAELVLVVLPLLSFVSRASYDRRVEAYGLATTDFVSILIGATLLWFVGWGIFDWIKRGFADTNR
ncbi:hypothetical protein NKJ50_09800 [Mesorhizobium sp. M0115]|uniref:hypothetical protein n=1 Tax=Mesorhizobium sp. M0115 TaxID=2956883 RepID=UPI00333D7686